jgi:hypothetical protein
MWELRWDGEGRDGHFTLESNGILIGAETANRLRYIGDTSRSISIRWLRTMDIQPSHSPEWRFRSFLCTFFRQSCAHTSRWRAVSNRIARCSAICADRHGLWPLFHVEV